MDRIRSESFFVDFDILIMIFLSSNLNLTNTIQYLILTRYTLNSRHLSPTIVYQSIYLLSPFLVQFFLLLLNSFNDLRRVIYF